MVKITDLIVGIVIVGISMYYYLFASAADKADLLSVSYGPLFVGIIFVLAGILMLVPESVKNTKKDIYQQPIQKIQKTNIPLVIIRVFLALYLVLVGVGPLIGKSPLPDLPFFLISSGIPVIFFTIAGLFQIIDSFRK